MERSDWLRAISWIAVARGREETALRYLEGGYNFSESGVHVARDTRRAEELIADANAAWVDAIVALLRALAQP